MNIFILDKNLVNNSHFYCDKHVVKIILEISQLLSNSYYVTGKQGFYKQTHKNHPCSLWVSECIENWKYAYKLLNFLEIERRFRFNNHKEHKSLIKLNNHIDEHGLPNLKENILMTEPPKCMPDKYKTCCVVDSYRRYVKYDKTHLLSWTKRKPPFWLEKI